MRNENYEIQYSRLMADYQSTNNPEILEEIFLLTDKQVFDEKRQYHLRHIAFERLKELEKIVDLPCILTYRKDE
jgi:hypothetical protein